MHKVRQTVLCCFMILIVLFSSVLSFADTASDTVDLSRLSEDYIIVINSENPDIAVCGLEKNPDSKCYPASTTKILTCIIALEEGDLQQIVTVPPSADSDRVAGTNMGLQKKESFSLKDLLYGMMLPSGNDAAIAIAISLYGSIDSFAKRMNEKAREIGMTHSHFVNPNGLHNEKHYSTARDMAKLAAYAMQNSTFRKIVSTTEYTAVSAKGRRIKLRTTNRYLRNYQSNSYTPKSVLWDEAIGIKTGETNFAGKCLIAAAERNGTVYIAALFHGDMPPSKAGLKKQDSYSVRRYNDARKLLEYAFANDLITVSIDDLIARGVPVELRRGQVPDQPDVLSSDYRIEWDHSSVVSKPACEFPQALLSDPIPSEMIRVDWFQESVSPGSVAGTISVLSEGQTVFQGSVICSSVEHPTPTPTAEPTPLPTSTPTPTPHIEIKPVLPSSTAPAPTVTAPPVKKPFLLSCSPVEQP